MALQPGPCTIPALSAADDRRDRAVTHSRGAGCVTNVAEGAIGHRARHARNEADVVGGGRDRTAVGLEVVERGRCIARVQHRQLDAVGRLVTVSE